MSSQAKGSPSEVPSARPASNLTSFPAPSSLPLSTPTSPPPASNITSVQAPANGTSSKARSRSRRRGRRTTPGNTPPLPTTPGNNSMTHQVNTTIPPGKSSHTFDIPYPSPPVLSPEEVEAQEQQYQSTYFQPQPQVQAQPPSYKTTQPQTQPNYPPPGQGSYQPQGQANYPPQGQANYSPQGQANYSPQGQAGYPTQSQPSYQPQGQSSYQPQGQHSYPPPAQAPIPTIQSLQSHPAYAAAMAQQAATLAAQQAQWDTINNAKAAISTIPPTQPLAARPRTPTVEHPVQVPVRIVNPTPEAPKRQIGDGGSGQGNLRLRLDLNLDVEITLKATIRGDLTLALL